MVQSSHEEFEFIVEHDGEQEVLRGICEQGGYVRLYKHLLTLHPAVKAAVRNVKDAMGARNGRRVNNVWVAVDSEESDNSIRPGQNLLANVRVEKLTGGFVIAAGVALGAIVAIEAIRRSHNEP